MVREIKAAPLLFGYRGSEEVDVAAVEELLRRVAQLKNDLPQVSSLDLMLVLAGAEGATRAARRRPGRAGGRRPLGLVRPRRLLHAGRGHAPRAERDPALSETALPCVPTAMSDRIG